MDNEKVLDTCDYCAHIPLEIEEEFKNLPERRRLQETMTTFQSIVNGQSCQKNYLCAPMCDLRARLMKAVVKGNNV